MLNKKNQILLYSLLSLMMNSISAADNKEDNKDGVPRGSKPFQNVETADMLTVEIKDPKVQFVLGLQIIDTLSTLASDQHVLSLRAVVDLLTTSAQGKCEQAQIILPVWQYNLGVSLIYSLSDLALEKQIPILRETIELFKKSISGGDNQAKQTLPWAQYKLGHALAFSANSVMPFLEAIPQLREAMELFNLSTKAGRQEPKGDLPTVKFLLGCHLTKSSSGQVPDLQIPILREAIDLLQACPNSEMQLSYAYYFLGVALKKLSGQTPEKEISLYREAVVCLSESEKRENVHAKKVLPSWQQDLAAKLANSAEQFPFEARVEMLREAIDLLKKSSRMAPMYRTLLPPTYYNLAAMLLEYSSQVDTEKSLTLLTQARDSVHACIAEGIDDDIIMDLLARIEESLTLQSTKKL